MTKSPDAFRTISEVAALLETPAHVLRFWESRFQQIKPMKGAGGRRYYRPDDIALLGGIKVLLHEQGMTIKGVERILKDRGPRYVAGLSPLSLGVEGPGEDAAPVPAPDPAPALDPVIVGPWLQPGGDESSAEPTQRPSLLEEFVLGTLSRLSASADEEADGEAKAAHPPPAKDRGEPSVARLREALSRADAARLRQRAQEIAPLVARLAALRQGASGQER